MSPPNRIRILNTRVDQVTFADALEQAKTLSASGKPNQIITANALMFLAAQEDPALKNLIDQASLVVPESWGIAWASRRQSQTFKEIIPGIDLMTALCRQARDHHQSVYLLGAKPGVAEQAAQALQTRYPGLQIAGCRDGYFRPEEEPMMIEQIRRAAPTYLFVGLSVPGQEKWIARNLPALGVPVVMGVGGSFDVLSGRLRRAPAWMRRMGIEWVYRTLQEPWRLKRIKDLPVFMWKVLCEKP